MRWCAFSHAETCIPLVTVLGALSRLQQQLTSTESLIEQIQRVAEGGGRKVSERVKEIISTRPGQEGDPAAAASQAGSVSSTRKPNVSMRS